MFAFLSYYQCEGQRENESFIHSNFMNSFNGATIYGITSTLDGGFAYYEPLDRKSVV